MFMISNLSDFFAILNMICFLVEPVRYGLTVCPINMRKHPLILRILVKLGRTKILYIKIACLITKQKNLTTDIWMSVSAYTTMKLR